MDVIPTLAMFGGTATLVILMLELGYRLGRHRRSSQEKETPVGAFAAAMLGLLAFMLGFTFNLAAERFQTKRGAVRDEAAAIQTAYLRSDFLPEPDRSTSKALLARHVARVLRTPYDADLRHSLDSNHELWTSIARPSSLESHFESNLGALYLESITQVFEVESKRVSLSRPYIKPWGWIALFGLTALAVMGIGYQTAISGSKRSKAGIFLALSFALVISLIADLDHLGGLIRVSNEPLESLQSWMAGMQVTAHAEAPR